MSGFFKKVGEEIEKTLDAVEPTAGDPQGLDVSRVAEAEGLHGVEESQAADEPGE